MKVALVSLNQIWEDKQRNVYLCSQYIEKAKSEDVELIIFPEMTLTGFTMNTELSSEFIKDSFSIKHFCDFAKKHNIAIVFGLVIKEEEKPTNNIAWIDKNGNLLTLGKKIHPFSFAKEDKFFTSGILGHDLEELKKLRLMNSPITLS